MAYVERLRVHSGEKFQLGPNDEVMYTEYDKGAADYVIHVLREKTRLED